LEYIVVPKIEYVIKYIITELDERSKEEKFKIKKILANKRKHKENEELQKEQAALASKQDDTIFDNHDEDEDEQLFK
jgi:hypothetical protein